MHTYCMSYKDTVLKAVGRKRSTVNVQGETVHIQSLHTVELLTYQALPDDNTVERLLYAIRCGVVDPDGKPVFDESDQESLRMTDLTSLSTLVNAIVRLSVPEQAIDEAKKD